MDACPWALYPRRMKAPGLVCALAAAACSSAPAEGTRVAGLIRQATMYSAYDRDHDYRVVVNVMPGLVREVILDQDPDSRIDWTSVRWSVDPAFVDRADYPPLAGAALLTTKRAGKTHIGVSFETTAAARLQSEATLVITAASSDEWHLGDEYFNRGEQIKPPAAEDRGACGLPQTVELPVTHSCLNCHDSRFGFGGPITPLDLADRADDELLAIFTEGTQPARGFAPDSFISVAEREGADSACIFKRMHTADDCDAQTARGILWKLRSLDSVVPKDFDPELINNFKPDSGL